VSSCLQPVVPAIGSGEAAAAGTPAGTLVLPAADLEFCGSGTVTVAGTALSKGDLALFGRPVVTAPVVICRDGTVKADGWLPGYVRLGELEPHLGEGVIEAIVDAAVAAARLRPRQRRRLLSYPLVIRLMIAMTLMPHDPYCGVMASLAGLLQDIPFALEWHVPTSGAYAGWRMLIPADLLEEVFWHVAGTLVDADDPAARTLAGKRVQACDGTLVNLAGTQENRKAFGSTGTADGSGPFPQLRIVALTEKAGHAMLGAVLGRCGLGEQTLLKRLAKRRPELFDKRVTCFDRLFPGHALVAEILSAGGDVIARASATLSLPMDPDDGWQPDGSRMSWLNAPSGREEDRIRLRVCEHSAIMPGEDGEGTVSETCTLLTTILNWEDAPADQVRDAYASRWSASETTFGEDKTTITGAGKRTSGPVFRSGHPRLVVQEAWAWLAGTQLVRASKAAALTSEYAGARALRRRAGKPVTDAEESFAAARRHATLSMVTSQVTAAASLEALAAAADSAARACLHTLNVPDRNRHSERKQKARPKFGHTPATKKTYTGKPQVIVYAPGFS
jgi:hypothetical protein